MDGPVSISILTFFWMPDTNTADDSVTTPKAKSVNGARLSNPSGDCTFKRVHDRAGALEERKHNLPCSPASPAAHNHQAVPAGVHFEPLMCEH